MEQDDEPIFVTCKNFDKCGNQEEVTSYREIQHHPWMRSDAYGLCTGLYCDHCYEHDYPYRRDRYYDPSYAGERMDDDY